MNKFLVLSMHSKQSKQKGAQLLHNKQKTKAEQLLHNKQQTEVSGIHSNLSKKSSSHSLKPT
jgi:hypothetical protein